MPRRGRDATARRAPACAQPGNHVADFTTGSSTCEARRLRHQSDVCASRSSRARSARAARSDPRLRGIQQRPVVSPIRSIYQQAQEGVADDGRKASQAISPIGLLPYPTDARRSAAHELRDDFGGCTFLRDEVRQHERVLQCHRSAARHVGGHRMSRIADQHDSSSSPRFVHHFLDGRKVKLLRRFDLSENLAHRRSEVAENLSEALDSSLRRICDRPRSDPIGVAIHAVASYREEEKRPSRA